MIIEIYGKQDCELCQTAKKKVIHFLRKWEMSDSVQVVFHDTETVEGAAESDYFDVFEIPSVLVKKDPESVVARWDGHAPPSEELRRRLTA